MGIEEAVAALVFILMLAALVVVESSGGSGDYSAICVYWGVDFLDTLCGPGHPYR